MSSNTQIEAIAGNQKTMSSREIAELTGKEHRNVMRDIRTMLVDLHGEGGVLSFEQTQINEQNGQTYPIYRLPKRETLILVSGYSVQMRAKIIDRWQELEAQHKAPVALSRLQLIEMAMESEKERLAAVAKSAALEEKIQAQAPKVEALSRIALSDGSFCLRDTAKNLQVREKDLYSFLVENRWIYRRPTGGAWLAYDDVRHRLLLEHKVTEGQREDGTNWSKSQVRVTTKGLAKLAEMLAEPPKEAAA